jgi:phosphate transport system permease protein
MNGQTKILKGSRLAALLLTLVPLLMFLAVVSNLVYASLPALTQAGLPVLFSTVFSTIFSGTYVEGQYGLTPSLWGTFLLLITALLIAFPVSLAMAIFATEFSVRGVGQAIEPVLALFSGIPPILYGLLSVFVLTAFIQPKFTGMDLPDPLLRSMPGLSPAIYVLLPRNNSILLGGIMIGLLIIPFMAPLMLDAIRSVPQSMKEASLALGATRWHTLGHVTLPAALSGIAAALSLGALKTIGEVVIAAWTIGYIANGLPVPLFDILEDKAPLASAAAGLMSGLIPGGSPRHPLDGSVAYFSGLLLLLMAFAIMGAVSLAQRYLRRRFAR